MRHLTSLLAALLLGSAAGVVLVAGPATAAACAQGVGVTVVVGGAVSCDGNGGGDAASNFEDAGHSLTYVSSQPGMVCQVDGAPNTSCAKAPPANKYWGLFWSAGTSGTWKYSSLGVSSLNVPKGGWVAFVFQNSNSKTYPSMKPLVASAPKPTTPTAKPKPKPTNKPTTQPTSEPKSARTTSVPATSSTVPTTATPTPTASTATTPTPSASTITPKPTASPTVDVHEDLPVTQQEAELEKAASSKANDSSNGLGWVAGGIAVLLIAGMGVTVWRRRATGGPS